MDILITGHTSGIGKVIFDNFDDTYGLCRSTGFDITKNNIQNYLNDKDIFVNNAWSSEDPLAQTKLIYQAKDYVKRIICIGSNTIYDGIYKDSKKSLENACLDLYNTGYNITLIKLGKVDTPFLKDSRDLKIEISYIIKIFEFILFCPYRIEQISIRPDGNC